jgi:hypothetical protein
MRTYAMGHSVHFIVLGAIGLTSKKWTGARSLCHFAQIVVQDLLPRRVLRAEPRVIERRPKPLPRMNKPHDVLKPL